MKAYYDENNFKLANIYSSIGQVYTDQGKLDEALEILTKCLNIMKNHYGENNFNLATVYNNIAAIF
jgi:tetratricopeptide (TPR) repeat protein